MSNSLRTTLACAALAAALAPLAVSAADDRSATSPQAVPCSSAASAMKATNPGDAMHSSDATRPDAQSSAPASVDASYGSAIAAQMKTVMDMTKLEMRCGRDAKMKAAAEKALPDLQRILTTLTIF